MGVVAQGGRVGHPVSYGRKGQYFCVKRRLASILLSQTAINKRAWQSIASNRWTLLPTLITTLSTELQHISRSRDSHEGQSSLSPPLFTMTDRKSLHLLLHHQPTQSNFNTQPFVIRSSRNTAPRLSTMSQVLLTMSYGLSQTHAAASVFPAPKTCQTVSAASHSQNLTDCLVRLSALDC